MMKSIKTGLPFYFLMVLIIVSAGNTAAGFSVGEVQDEETVTISGYALSAQERFAAANNLLNEHRYNEALAAFRTIVREGKHNGPLYLNMGIAATRLDSLGLAQVYFTIASGFSETVRASQEGLDFVTDQLARRGAQLPELGWISIHNLFYFQINYAVWLAVGVLLVNVGVIWFILVWLRERYRPVNRNAAIVTSAAGLLVVMASIAFSLQADRYEQGVQIVREASVYVTPDSESDVVQTAFEGFRFIVSIPESNSYDGWVRVRMVNGARGWVREETIYRF
ncbi:MAG: hypothetical protein JJU41_03195 [Bacteroidetes bacterium]|nr:hypothetical protein [Bacteroidota bacterium]